MGHIVTRENRRVFLGSLALGAAAFATRGVFKDFIYKSIRDAKARDSVTVDFTPIPDSRIGELAAKFDVVLGFTPEG